VVATTLNLLEMLIWKGKFNSFQPEIVLIRDMSTDLSAGMFSFMLPVMVVNDNG